MKKHHLETLITEADAKAKIEALGKQITEHYKAKNADSLVVIGLLRGSFMFMADLVRYIDIPVEIDFMTASSYGNNMVSSHDVKITKDLETDIYNRHILIVEDIIDTGYTLNKIREILSLRNPASLEICTLLDKPSRREVDVPVRWVGFPIPDEFVVGYGIDYAQYHRNLNYIAQVVMDE